MVFHKELIQWYLQNNRSLPWRKTKDPYFIWLSEIMLQQTRVDQALPYFEKFITRFPTVLDFANAEQDHIARLLVETKEDADSVIIGLKQAVSETPDVLSKKERDELDNAINSLQEVINLDNRDIILLKMTVLNKIAEGFIQKHLDKGVHLHLKGRHIDEINNN